MAELAIITKLNALLNKGIATEAEALYLMVETRKLLEQRDLKLQYPYLTFYCDWAVHPRLAGPTAQKILRQFDRATVHLKKGIALRDLPDSLALR